jgi:hypothetical protein
MSCRLPLVLLSRFVAIVITLLAVGVPTPGAAQDDPAQRLVDRHAPIAYLRNQEAPCDRDGEGYFPAPVESVLGNPDIALKVADTDSSQTDTVIKMAPTAQDLAGLDDTYYLDFPGNPRRPGCTYETHFKTYAEAFDLEPTTYAHIVVDHENELLVIQYWLWYYFNDWNNLHEGDWEVIQAVFEATSVEEALERDPIRFAYAQHGGGELADYNDDKLLLDNGRPAIYPAAGSHATHYEQALYLGWGENGTGFGCDNSTAPSTAVPLNAILVPDDPDPESEFGWLLFEGRWGERQPWEFNGPRSPNATNRWVDPVADMEFWRDSSIEVPTRNVLGPNVTDTFCELTTLGSVLISYMDIYRTEIVLGALLVLFGLIALMVKMWSAIGPSLALYRQDWPVFLGIGLGAIPIGILFNLLRLGMDRTSIGRWVIAWFNDTPGASWATIAIAGSFQYLAIILLVMPAIIIAIMEVQQGKRPGIVTSYRQAFQFLGPMAIAAIIVSVTAGLLASTGIGLLVAIWLLVRWQFYPQAIVRDHVSDARDALALSVRTVRGRWLSTLALTVSLQLFAIVPGPIIGFVFLVIGGVTVQTANAVAGLLYAITIPIATLGLTLVYQQRRATVS